MIRGIQLRGAVAVNMITMIGIGPLITVPLVIASLHGSLALTGWIVGAVVAACDGLVWAELASRYPGSGGTYVYLREAFGRDRWGRLLAFLFNWQFLFSAPLLLASGYIGFSQYAGYLFPQLAASPGAQHVLGAALGLIVLALLYRRVTAVANVGFILAIAATVTLLVVIAAGLPHVRAAVFVPPGGSHFGSAFVGALGAALVITLYDYSGYNNAALVGDEVIGPVKTIPRAILLSIGIVGVLYVLLQTSILSLVPWQHMIGSSTSQYVASTAVATAWGPTAARVATVLILITAFASTYGLLLGFSRIPYAAALDDAFFPIFARLHPKGRFPHVSLLAVGLLALPACFFTLDRVIQFLTAGIVVIQAIAQIGALALLRRRGPAPFRMWLYPLPAVVALVAWAFIFYSSGTAAMRYGILTLLAGVAVYCIAARLQRAWPFAIVTAVVLLVLACSWPAHARAATAGDWHAGGVTTVAGYPVFIVDNRPFFVYGAAFFYERIPRSQWEQSLLLYRALGINTIDLYVMWNWHEVRDGDFDFTGRTNPRRDLVGLLRLIHRYGFKTIVRPGPVIRNEWRNGGYPAWLLERPEYDMPLHDVLEGRYPATATLQNTRSDDAAAQWMANATHMRYATRWLQTALQAVAPFKDDVIAVALDDDQGAYIDNQTWPAPHFQQYISQLRSVVQGSVGSAMPLFINTYQMKVTASAPVWAWGNWYQSDAYSIGEHDRSQLEFSTGLIGTQPGLPIMTSEFQAGWLQGAGEARPRPADPTNTTLALHTMLQAGARGVVNFPVQDTLDPAGWEAPWTNAFYSWDAASAVQLSAQPRWNPTQRFGGLVNSYGPYLATLHSKPDLAIAYMTSAYDPSALTNAQIAQIAAATIVAQQRCREAVLTCALVDLRYASLHDLQRYPAIIMPPNGIALPVISGVASKLDAFRSAGGTTTASFAQVRVTRPAAGGIPNATLLADPLETSGLLDIVNYETVARRTPVATIRLRGRSVRLPVLTIPARGAVTIPINVPLAQTGHGFGSSDRLSSTCGVADFGSFEGKSFFFTSTPKESTTCSIDLVLHGKRAHRFPNGPPLSYFAPAVTPSGYAIPLRGDAFIDTGTFFAFVPPHAARVGLVDAFEDGSQTAVFENASVRLFVSPDAGGRSLVFEDKATGDNLFTTVGALRDDVAQPLPMSTRDYIGKYTHPIAAGTFNRSYAATVLKNGTRASAEFAYDAPDMPPHGVRFVKIVSMLPDDAGFTVDERADFHGSDVPATQAAVVLSSIAVTPQTVELGATSGCGFFDPAKRRVVLVAWHAGDVTTHAIARTGGSALLTLTFARDGWRRTVYAERPVISAVAAQSVLDAFSANAGPGTGDSLVP